MQISALKENFNNENRVALTPDAIKLFQRLGLEVLIEDVAGKNSGYPNELYKENGAKIVSRNECLQADICLCVKMPNEIPDDVVAAMNALGSGAEVAERVQALSTLNIDAIWWRDHGTWEHPEALRKGLVEEVLPRL